MTTRPLEEQLATLWDAVLNLALPASEQLAILEAVGDKRAIDELALDYDDNFWEVRELATLALTTRQIAKAKKAAA